MRYLEDTSLSFAKVNEFLNQANISTINVKGDIEVYDFVLYKDDDCSQKRYNFWQESIQNFVSNPPEDYPRERVDWLQHKLGWWKIVVRMIIVMEHMNHPGIHREQLFWKQEPFKFFRDSTIEEFESIFDQKMLYEHKKVWNEKHDDDTGLWETIKMKVNKVISLEDPAIEMYIYEPIADANPFVSHYNALDAGYFFFCNPKKKLIIGMQFCIVGYVEMNDIIERNKKAQDDDAKKRELKKAKKKASEEAKKKASEKAGGAGGRE